MRKISIVLIMIFSLLLVSCGNSSQGLSKKERNSIVTVKNIDPFLRSVEVELEINDPDDKLTNKTLLLRIMDGDDQVYHKDLKVEEPKEDEEKQDIKVIKHLVSGLKENHEYRLEVTVSLSVKNRILKYGLVNEKFKTLNAGLSEDNPILISSVEDFLKIGKETDADLYYKLANDIDFLDYDEEGLYEHQFETRRFQGTFDGNGFTIKNFKINKSISNISNIGLFPYNSGTIKNLTVENGLIELLKSSDYNSYIGIVTGRNLGTIENVTVVDSKIKLGFIYTGKVYVGGIAGKSESRSEITDVNSKLEVDIVSLSRTEFSVGSVIGHLDQSTLTNANGILEASIENADSGNIGGLIGHVSDSKVNNITSLSTIKLNTIIRNISYKERMEIIVGGAFGLQIDSNIENVYVKSEINVLNIVNNAVSQSDHDKIFIGGFIGKSATPKQLKEVLIETNIKFGKELEEEDETILFKDFNEISIGGAIGQQSVNSKHINIFVYEPTITVNSGEGNYYISPTAGVIQDKVNVDFFNGTIILNEDIYTNKLLKWFDIEVEVEPEEAEVITKQELIDKINNDELNDGKIIYEEIEDEQSYLVSVILSDDDKIVYSLVLTIENWSDIEAMDLDSHNIEVLFVEEHEIETVIVKELVEYDLEETDFNNYFDEDSFVLKERDKLNN